MATDEAFFKANGLLCLRKGDLPVGLTLSSVRGDDARLALAVEAVLRGD